MDFEPEECIFSDAIMIIDTRKTSNVTCNYNSGELELYDGPAGVYGYSGDTVWIYQGCNATEFEACIGLYLNKIIQNLSSGIHL